MSESAQTRPIPVGILVSVSDARPRTRTKPRRREVVRLAVLPPLAPPRWLAAMHDLPWYAFLAVGVALWAIGGAACACAVLLPAPSEVATTLPDCSPPRALASTAELSRIPTIVDTPSMPAVTDELPPSSPEPPLAAVDVVKPVPPPEITLPREIAAPVCDLGTPITFVKNPVQAFKAAKQENKLVFIVHLSGNFEDKEFT
jgi:hypothetical protein